jgi:hypothetical protein
MSKSSHEVAKAIAVCEGVRKVFLTSGDFGFVVSASIHDERSAKEMQLMAKRIEGVARAKIVVGHFVYAQRSGTAAP